MIAPEPPSGSEVFRTRWIHEWGRVGWSITGIAVAAVVIYLAFAAVSGLVVPLVISLVIGVLGVPLVDRLERMRVPRRIAAVLFMVTVFVVVGGAFGLAIEGIVDQGDQVSDFVAAGVDVIGRWLADLDAELPSGSSMVDSGGSMGGRLLPGAAGLVGSVFSSAMAFLVGTLLASIMLYYILVDWETIRTWLGEHLNMPSEVGAEIVDDSTAIVRQGFYALTLSSLAVATLIGVTMAILGIPLVFTVTIVTFVTSYIPYLGAVLSGAFAFLVALGASGFEDAVILLIVILIVQNIVQTVVGNKLTSDRLRVHPIASLSATLVGATVAGLLGAMLSSLVLAIVLAVMKRVRTAQAELAIEAT